MDHETGDRLKHLAGFYNYVDPPQMLPHPDGGDHLDSIRLHEQAHETLANRTTVGFALRHLVGKVGSNKGTKDAELVKCIAELTEDVQEGYATYVEYQQLSPKPEIEDFRRHLRDIGDPAYLRGFDRARLIDFIVPETDLTDYEESERQHIRHCLLTDITRFSMNMPLCLDEDPTVTAEYLRGNSPSMRWKVVLTTLAENRALQERLFHLGQSTFDTWVLKYRQPSQDGRYTGPTYADHVEGIIAELFPALPWEHVDAWATRHRIPATTRSEPERIEEYIGRQATAEFRFVPRTRIELGWMPGGEVLRALAGISASVEHGCYIKVVPNLSGKARKVNLGHDVDMSPGESCVICHEATFTETEDGRRWWNYWGGGLALRTKTEFVPMMLEAAESPDCVVLVDCALEGEDPFRTVFEWCQKKPLFATVSPAGPAASFQKTVTDGRIVDGGADVLMTKNWMTYRGAGSDQVRLIWVIPRAVDGRLSICLVTTPKLGAALVSWLQERGPSSVRVVEGIDRIVAAEAERARGPQKEGSTKWQLGLSESRAPANADVATSHLLSEGW